MFLTRTEIMEIIEKIYRKDTIRIIIFSIEAVLEKFKKEMPAEKRLHTIFKLTKKMRKHSPNSSSKKRNEIQNQISLIIDDIYKESCIIDNLTWKLILNFFRLCAEEWYIHCNFLGWCNIILFECLFAKYEDLLLEEEICKRFLKFYDKTAKPKINEESTT